MTAKSFMKSFTSLKWRFDFYGKQGENITEKRSSGENDGKRFTDGLPHFLMDCKGNSCAVSNQFNPRRNHTHFMRTQLLFFRTVNAQRYSGDLEIALIPEWFRNGNLYKERWIPKGVLMEKAASGRSVKFALLFEFRRRLRRPFRHVLYNARQSRRH